MQSMRHLLSAGMLAIFLLGLCTSGSARADNEPLCDALEQALEPLYEVPMGTEDWDRIHALTNAARAIDCAFMINE